MAMKVNARHCRDADAHRTNDAAPSLYRHERTSTAMFGSATSTASAASAATAAARSATSRRCAAVLHACSFARLADGRCGRWLVAGGCCAGTAATPVTYLSLS